MILLSHSSTPCIKRLGDPRKPKHVCYWCIDGDGGTTLRRCGGPVNDVFTALVTVPARNHERQMSAKLT